MIEVNVGNISVAVVLKSGDVSTISVDESRNSIMLDDGSSTEKNGVEFKKVELPIHTFYFHKRKYNIAYHPKADEDKAKLILEKHFNSL